jgi:hypothetical protein
LGSISATTGRALIIAGLATEMGSNFGNASWTNGFSGVNDFTQGIGVDGTLFGGGVRIVSSTGTYSTTASSNISGAWRGQIAAII